MSKRKFRFFLFFIFVGWVILFSINYFLFKPTESYFDVENIIYLEMMASGDEHGILAFAFVFYFSALFSFVISFLALFFFKKWAIHLLLSSFLFFYLFFILNPFYFLAWKNILIDLYLVSVQVFILTLIYFGPAGKLFKKSDY